MAIRQTLLIMGYLATCAPVVYAQFSVVPIAHAAPPPKSGSQAVQRQMKTEEEAALTLPFWDDFSFSNSTLYPHDTLWQSGKSVRLSYGMGIDPPSLGVVVFDGLDETGNPYSVNDPLERGVADRLVSIPLQLDKVPESERASVTLSFYYQYRGNGEPPDREDQLQVLFKDSSDVWTIAYTLENNGTFDPNTFTPVSIAVRDERYFHDNFQFGIQSYGRLSGPYDTWIIDYVYINSKRSLDDNSYPDRTISVPLSSMLKDYWSMPLGHFIEDPQAYLKVPFLALHNMEFVPGNTTREDEHPINYSAAESLTIYGAQGKKEYAYTLDDATFFGVMKPREFSKKAIQTLPVVAPLTEGDSLAVVELKLWINTNDNNVDPNASPPGDYAPIKYAPIDFRYNDTTYATYTFADYYAYDDGIAEYGAVLNKSGAQVAYLFDMKTTHPDTVVALDLYFPDFGSNTDQSVELQILNDLENGPGSMLHRETVQVVKGSQNKFWRHKLSTTVIVKDRFYIGWKQTGTVPLTVGLDKNTDSSDNIFYNTNGSWQRENNLSGSLMMRPVFGQGQQIITGVQKDRHENISNPFPNPGDGSFTLLGKVDRLSVYDPVGRAVDFSIEPYGLTTRVTITDAKAGIYILRWWTRGAAVVRRVTVR